MGKKTGWNNRAGRHFCIMNRAGRHFNIGSLFLKPTQAWNPTFTDFNNFWQSGSFYDDKKKSKFFWESAHRFGGKSRSKFLKIAKF